MTPEDLSLSQNRHSVGKSKPISWSYRDIGKLPSGRSTSLPQHQSCCSINRPPNRKTCWGIHHPCPARVDLQLGPFSLAELITLLAPVRVTVRENGSKIRSHCNTKRTPLPRHILRQDNRSLTIVPLNQCCPAIFNP